MNKSIILLLNTSTNISRQLFLLGIFLFFFTTTAIAANTQSSVLQCQNIEFTENGAQLGRSGKTLFSNTFESQVKWTVENYLNLLDLHFGREYDGVKALYVTRTKEEDPKEEFPKDTAWNVISEKFSLEDVKPGDEYVLRISSLASKAIEEAIGTGYHSGITWYRADGEVVTFTSTPIYSDVREMERIYSGTIPEGAVSCDLRVGFDIPNIEVGEYIIIRSISFDIIEDYKSYTKPGEFYSNFYENGKILWDADIPEKTSIVFQASTATFEAEDELGDFSPFFGPDGTTESYYHEPFEVEGDFVRYKARLIPNGTESPVLRSVKIGDHVDCDWSADSVLETPCVKLVGEYSKPSLKRDAHIEFEIVTPAFIRGTSFKLLLDDVDVTSSFLIERTASNTWRGRYVLGEELSEELHKLVIEYSNIFDEAVVATRYFLVGETPTTPVVTLRDDGTTLIDGEPFFPIGLYGVCEREFNNYDIDEAFRGLKEAGFNFAHSYSIPREDRFLQAAEKYGFKLWSVARFPDKRFVEIERHSPAIIAWYLGDDTSMNTKPTELYDYFYSCKAVDPTRLTVQADPIGASKRISNYQPYVKGTDAFLPEIYPVHKDGEEAGWDCIAQTALDIKRSRSDALKANDGPKAIWGIIQYFQGWGWERFPTYAELRGMSFASLAAGANGITWYTYGGFVEPENGKYNYGVTSSSERWNNISRIATQIKELIPALVEQTDEAIQPSLTIVDGPDKDCFNNDSIVYLLKRLNSEYYLLTVNATHEPVEFKLSLPNSRSLNDVEVLFDEKTIASPKVTEGVIQERVEGFGVRVYHWCE